MFERIVVMDNENNAVDEEIENKENKKEKKKILTEDDVLKILDVLYKKAAYGIKNVSPSIEDLAADYLEKNSDVKKAAKSMLNYQIAKCTTSGFITGFGGIIAMPVTLPANITSVLYVQLRMIACTAYMAGYDINCDQTQTLVYACLAGVSVNQLLKSFGIKFGQKFAQSMIKKIPGKALTKINQRVGFRLVTKFGEKGLINMGKLIPGVGAIINGGFDFAETKAIAHRAYKMFIDGDFSVGEDVHKKQKGVKAKKSDAELEIIDVDPENIEIQPTDE